MRELFANCHDYIYVYNFAQKRYQYISDSVKNLTGFSKEEMFELGPDDIYERFHPDDREKLLNVYEKAKFDKPLKIDAEVVFRWKCKQGDYRWYSDRRGLIYDGDGSVKAIVGMALDITKYVRGREQLEASEQRYRDLVECSADAVWRVDVNGYYTFMSSGVKEMTGYDPEELIGKHFSVLLTEESSRWASESMMKRVSGAYEDKNLIFKLHHRRRDGSEYVSEIRSAPIYNAEGEVVEIQGTSRDITERERSQHEIDRYKLEVNHSERLAMLGTMVSTVAHELNQPLTVIQLFLQDCLQVLKEGGDKEQAVEDIRDSLVEVEKANSVIHRYQQFSRRPADIHVESIDIKSTVEKMVRVFKQQANLKKLKLVVDESLAEVPKASGKIADLEQVFFILIENAIQAADGSRRTELKIGGEVDNGCVILSFEDNCGGIKPGDMERIFEPFFSTKSAQEGTGLGLCILKRILDKYGGKVNVENQAGEGVCFYVLFRINDRNVVDLT